MTCSPPQKSSNAAPHPRNRLNDLAGAEWLKLTRSFWISEKCGDDKDAFAHPAPFLVRDTMKLVSLFTKRGMTALDPFCGSGTTLLAAANLGRMGIGIDLSEDYKRLAERRLAKKNYEAGTHYRYILAGADDALAAGDLRADYIVTSPPYHNILQNKSQGLRKKSGKGYRNGARVGVEYYSDDKADLGNLATYPEFLAALEGIMMKCRDALADGRYCTVIMSDFTVQKRETCVQADIVSLMLKAGFEFRGTTVLLQNNKPLYPFGYPHAYVINHQHQNIMNFRKR